MTEPIADDPIDPADLLAALDETEAAGVPLHLVEHLRWLVEQEAATRPGGWFYKWVNPRGRDFIINFHFPASGSPDWPHEILGELRTGRRFVVWPAPRRAANGWLDDKDSLHPISALPGDAEGPRLVRVTVENARGGRS